MSNLLSKLGLSRPEAEVYESILDLGNAGISEISKNSGLYRPVVYQVLPRLLEKNLVAVSQKGKRKVYFAQSPKNLESLVKDLKINLDAQMPELMNKYASNIHRPQIKYFEGKNAIRHVYEDLLATIKKGDIYYRYESPRNYKAYRKYTPQEYYDRVRDKGDVERLIITNDITKKQKQERLGRLVKAVPPEYDLFVYEVNQLIYGDKVAIIDFRTETASIIESATIAEFQKKIFKLLFDKL
ncbi:MAG: helix-turn-helix domain-containing protein [Candidatus Magasanikbacteria bacterium]|nr:helix-turn-helix domain-containing protein [Candidatus Magasanikbacteria bacterium]